MPILGVLNVFVGASRRYATPRQGAIMFPAARGIVYVFALEFSHRRVLVRRPLQFILLLQTGS
jgi:hypothetical protein